MKTKGFSLLEVIIAIFVITIGIAGAVNLISYNISAVAISKSQIIAASLAQEGLEIVRAIRDNNWLQDATWNSGLGTCSTGCRVQYNNPGLIAFADTFLQINNSGFYGYNGVQGFSGTDTLFKRKITITNVDALPTQIKVVCEVTWSQRGRSFVIGAQDRLYNWK